MYKGLVFTCSLLSKGLIGDEILWWYDIHVKPTNFLDKLCKIIVLMNFPDAESGIIIILKDASNVFKVICLEGPGNLKVFIIYQD